MTDEQIAHYLKIKNGGDVHAAISARILETLEGILKELKNPPEKCKCKK